MPHIGRVLGERAVFVDPTGGIAATLFQKMHPNTIPGKIEMLATDALKGVAMFFYVIACILTVVLLFVIDYAINNRFVSMVNCVAVADLRDVASEFIGSVHSLVRDAKRDFSDSTDVSDSDYGDDDDDAQFGAMGERSFADFRNSAARDNAAFQAQADRARAGFQAQATHPQTAFDVKLDRQSAFDAAVNRQSAAFQAQADRASADHAHLDFGTMGDHSIPRANGLRFSSQ